MSTTHQLGRALIVFGYALAAVGAVVSLIDNLEQSGASTNVREVLDVASYPASVIAGLCAWWFLSALVVTEERQRTIVRRAFVGLSVQAVAVSVVYFVVLSAGNTLTWLTTSFWLIGVGQVGASAGFFLLYLSYRSAPDPFEEVDASEPLAEFTG